jgi:catechol 2,3-dioxygenase-like lactoylglutathione lyase family enzyme
MSPRRTFANFLAAVLFCTASVVTAQQPAATPPVAPTAPATPPSPNLAGLAHVAIRVHDLDASVAFYQKLGFVRAFALSRDGVVYEAFIKINDQQFLELYPTDAKNTQIGFLHVCFYGHDLQSVHDYYVAQGLAPKDVRTAGAGNLLFTMPGPATPTGPQNMEYTQYMPASMHSKAVGQFLGADRIATEMTAVAIAVNDPAAATAFYTDKVGFTRDEMLHGSNIRLELPGASSESLFLVPAEKLGFKARIFFAADQGQAAAELKKRGIPFDQEPDALAVQDPDGNQIILY